MKKLLLYFVKCVNAFANDKLTAEQEAETILRYLLFKSDPLHTLSVNEALQRQLKTEMIKLRTQYSSICFKIEEVYPSEPVKIIHKLEDSTKN